MSKERVLGIDIGGTNIRLGVVDGDYALSGFEMHSCRRLLGDSPLENLAQIIRESLAANGAVGAVAIGVPAVVNKNHSFVCSAPNVYGLDSLELGLELEKRLDLPVFVDRDVNFILAHDIHSQRLDPEGRRTILGCYLGTGFGNSLYIGGRFHLGAHGSAGELGHIPLYGVEKTCPCGQTGCVETLVSGRYLQSLCEEAFPDCPISDVFVRHGDDARIQRFVRDTAVPVATEITLLDPDFIILGGGVMGMKGFPIEALKDEIRRRVRHPLPAEDLHFLLSQGSQTAGVLGGGMMVLGYLRRGEPFRL